MLRGGISVISISKYTQASTPLEGRGRGDDWMGVEVLTVHREAGCGINDFTGGGKVLEVGFRNKKDDRRQLGSWEGKIASVFCQRL